MRPSKVELERYWWHRAFGVVLWVGSGGVALAVLLAVAAETTRGRVSLTVSSQFKDKMAAVELRAVTGGGDAAAVLATELVPAIIKSGNSGIGCLGADGTIERAGTTT